MEIDFSAVKVFTKEVLLKIKKNQMHKNTFDLEISNMLI